MPDEIEIDGNEVEGLVVVGRVLAGGHGAGGEAVRPNHPDLRVQVFRNSLAGTGGSWSESEAVSVTQPRSRHPCAAQRPSLGSGTA